MAKLGSEYAIAGIGLIIGPVEGGPYTSRAMTAEAARLAIEDAGIKRSDVKCALEPIREGGGGVRESYSDAYPRVLGMNVHTYLRIGQRGASLAAPSIVAAMKMLDLGLSDYVVVASAVEDRSRAQKTRKANKIGMVHIDKGGYWGRPFGDMRAVSHHSFFMSRHKHEYGTTEEQMAMVPITARKWAAMTPEAQLKERPLTLEQYMAEPYFVYPYRKFDLCVLSDGAAAFIVTKAERARDLKSKPVFIRGVGFGEHVEEAWWTNHQHYALPLKTGMEKAFEQADVKLSDISFAQVPDCFTCEVILHVEDYGWCKKGEGGAFVAAGNIGPGGEIPVNTNGGWMAGYHLGDMGGFIEGVVQLRGDAGARQVKNAKFGIVAGGGGEYLSPGMCSIHSTIVLGAQ
jgi:acetyl-CoA acetyltransferase